MDITRHEPQTLRTLPRTTINLTFINCQIHDFQKRPHDAECTALRAQINVRTKLYLQPKTSEPHLTATDLRSLTLIDCNRKLWENIILHRINQQWHTHHTLSTLYHCQKGRGTDSALLQRAATTEAAEEADFNLYTSSWNFRKAFDSVSRPIINLAWARLGDPIDFVEWIAALDQDPHLIPTLKPTVTPTT
eukprot:gene6564-biopygen3163